MAMKTLKLLVLVAILMFNSGMGVFAGSGLTEEFLNKEATITNYQLLYISLTMLGNFQSTIFDSHRITYLLRPDDLKIEVTIRYRRDFDTSKRELEEKVLIKLMKLNSDTIRDILTNVFFEDLEIDPSRDIVVYAEDKSGELIAKWENGEYSYVYENTKNGEEKE